MESNIQDRSSTIYSVLLLMVLLLGSIMVQDATGSDDEIPIARDHNDKIKIQSDAELAAMAADNGWYGDGSPESPFVISYLMINGTDNYPCVYIVDVTYSLVITDCTFFWAGYISIGNDDPILLENKVNWLSPLLILIGLLLTIFLLLKRKSRKNSGFQSN